MFRQSDPELIAALGEIRRGRCPLTARALLAQCEGRRLDDDDGIAATQLFTHKDDCATMNATKLKQLPGQQFTFSARDTSRDESALATLRAGCNAPADLTLKVGAQVILTKTLDAAEGLVNGARGVVLRMLSTKNPVVRFVGGVERIIRMESFPLTQAGQVVACRMQLPLAHGWAISIVRDRPTPPRQPPTAHPPTPHPAPQHLTLQTPHPPNPSLCTTTPHPPTPAGALLIPVHAHREAHTPRSTHSEKHTQRAEGRASLLAAQEPRYDT